MPLPHEPTNREILNSIDTTLDTLLQAITDRGDAYDRSIKELRKELHESIQEVLDAINLFANSVDERFDQVDKRFTSIETTMATKTQLETFRADLALIARKSNTKLTILIEQLVSEKSLDPVIAQRILALEPFPQTA